MNNNANFDPITGQPINQNNNIPNVQTIDSTVGQVMSEMPALESTVEQTMSVVQPSDTTIVQEIPELQPLDTSNEIINVDNSIQTNIQDELRNIPTIEQDKQDFINNVQTANQEKKEEKKDKNNLLFIIIAAVVLLLAIYFLFPLLLNYT